ncbi:Hypothetical protein, putative [Bodo saltans]|uniref:GPI-anchored surface protein n=1 Tax=Bodo saltans TaxID=75058 RepID=A0A0S4IW62_BODSA|nr:Hypothetical protein, putative [Bodo saltans]|eukprot:CUF26248.1 Hypothetical protein, putative [Bodo saltans]
MSFRTRTTFLISLVCVSKKTEARCESEEVEPVIVTAPILDTDDALIDYLRDELYKGNLNGCKLSINTKLRVILIWLEEQLHPVPRKGLTKLCAIFKTVTQIVIQKKQLRHYIRSRHSIAQCYCNGRKTRDQGGGRKTCVENDDACGQSSAR